jgi:hypothetical protein
MKVVRVLCGVSIGAAVAAACGGKSVVGTGEELTDAGALEAATGSSSGSGDDNARSGPDATATTMPGFNVMCMSAQSCPRSQVCCGSFSFTGGGGITVACANSCGAGGFQVCATDAECARGQVCARSPVGLGSTCQAMGTMTATAPDAGARDAGSRDAGTPLDAEPIEAGTLVDAAVAQVEAGHAVPAPDASLAEAGAVEAGTVVEAGVPAAEASAPPPADDAASADDGESGADDATDEASPGP